MAGVMLSDEIKRINLDFNAKIANLRKEKDASERREYDRLATIKKDEEIARIAAMKRQSDETSSAVKSITDHEDVESSVISDSSGAEDEGITTEEIRSQNTKNVKSDSDTPSSSFARKDQTKAVIKRFGNLSEDGLFSKVKKTSTSSMKRRIERDDGDEMIKLLNMLKEDNTQIMRRLDLLEEAINQPTVSTANVDTSAETSHKGAFLALKLDWIPKIMKLLSQIYAEVQSVEEDK